MNEHESRKSWLASFQFAQYNKDIVNVERNLKNVSFMKSEIEKLDLLCDINEELTPHINFRLPLLSP